MTIGKQISKRRKELNMSMAELAKKVGKDRSTIYRYENGDIENFPLGLLCPIAEALETTPQELMPTTIVTSNEWLSKRAEEWFNATDRYEFSDEEVRLFHEIANYLITNRNRDDYEENLKFLFTFIKQLNK